MREVAILGAGELGGALAHVLARRNAAGRVRLVDEQARVAEGKALDVAQAAPIEGFSTRVVGSTDLSHAAGASIVLVADQASGGEWQGEPALMLLRRVRQLIPRAIVVCAGASQREVVERGVAEAGYPRQQLIGSAPEALRGAIRGLVALQLDVSPRDVSLSVLGVPPSHIVVPWEDASAGGFALTRMLSEPERRRLVDRVPALWPPGPHALAAAACKTIEALCGASRQLTTCFVAPDRSAGVRTRTAALPVRLNGGGIAEVVMPPLTAFEQVALDNAARL